MFTVTLNVGNYIDFCSWIVRLIFLFQTISIKQARKLLACVTRLLCRAMPCQIETKHWSPTLKTMRGSRKFSQRGSNVDNFYFYQGREDPVTTISGPLSTSKRNAIEMAHPGVPMTFQHWIWLDVWFFRGSGPVLLPDSLGGGSGPPVPPPSGSAHEYIE